MIVILTDFADSEFLGMIKGVLKQYAPDAEIIDLCNTIQPQNIREGAWVLSASYRYFPKSTVFLCVIDPGVGTARQAVAVQTENYYFVGPDNGLLWEAASHDGIQKVVALKTSGASQTFQGRDVFAPAAAKIQESKTILSLGNKTRLRKKLTFFKRGRAGEIVRIDSFGNIITNITHLNKKQYKVKLKRFEESLKFYSAYAAAPKGKLFLITSSARTLEIAIKGESANQRLNVEVGQRVTIS